MQVIEEIMLELKKIEGREDTPSLVLREELLKEIEVYISNKTGKLDIAEGFVVGRIENY